MKKILFYALTIIFVFGFTANAQQKDKNAPKKEIKKETVVSQKTTAKAAPAAPGKVFNKVCPVSGEDLDNNDVTYVYNGKTYGLCCKKCLAKFQKDPAKYAARLNEDGTKFTKK